MVHMHTHARTHIPRDASSWKWGGPKSRTSSPAPRAAEQLPPLNYSPPVNCHVNIHLQRRLRLSQWPAWKRAGPVNQPGDKSVLRDDEKRLASSWNVNVMLPQEKQSAAGVSLRALAWRVEGKGRARKGKRKKKKEKSRLCCRCWSASSWERRLEKRRAEVWKARKQMSRTKEGNFPLSYVSGGSV